MKTKLELTEENVIAIHEIGHYIFFLIGAIECTDNIEDYKKLVMKINKVNILTVGEVHGVVDIEDMDNIPFRNLVYTSGCLTAYHYYNRWISVWRENFDDLFYRTGGSNDIEESKKTEADLYKYEIKIRSLLQIGKLYYLIERLSTQLLGKKEFGKPMCTRLGMSLYKDLKTILQEENKKIGN